MTTDPNANASPESVADTVAGTDGGGNALPYEQAAMFYQSNMFGLSKDYAFPQGAYTSTALPDHATSLAKLLTRLTTPLADGNVYDVHDMLRTITKWILTQNVNINNDEPNAVNYGKTLPVTPVTPTT
jgi:hypothetical protein